MTKIITLVFVVAAIAACGKKADNGATAGSATVATGSGSAAGSGSDVTMGSAAGSGSAAMAAAVDVPTEQDFEDQASTDITDKNVEAKVKELETDLAP
jgi:hypothetical protein